MLAVNEYSSSLAIVIARFHVTPPLLVLSSSFFLVSARHAYHFLSVPLC